LRVLGPLVLESRHSSSGVRCPPRPTLDFKLCGTAYNSDRAGVLQGNDSLCAFEFAIGFAGGIPMKATCESPVAMFDFDVPPKTWPGSPRAGHFLHERIHSPALPWKRTFFEVVGMSAKRQ
jgi:hypothetical protein